MGKMSSRDNIAAGTACGMAHFINIFGERTKQYIEALTEKTKPKKVVVCMLYFLDQAGEGSWADAALSCLNYNTDPSLLQLLIQQMYGEPLPRLMLMARKLSLVLCIQHWTVQTHMIMSSESNRATPVV